MNYVSSNQNINSGSRLIRFKHNTYFQTKLLQSTNIDRSSVCAGQITGTGTQLTRRAHHTARQAHRVVRQDRLGGSIIVL